MNLLVLFLAATLPAPAPRPAALNAFADRPDCLPIPQQVAGEKREYRGTRLDQQPPAHLLLAVDRRVSGCPEATIIRRDVWTPPRR